MQPRNGFLLRQYAVRLFHFKAWGSSIILHRKQDFLCLVVRLQVELERFKIVDRHHNVWTSNREFVYFLVCIPELDEL